MSGAIPVKIGYDKTPNWTEWIGSDRMDQFRPNRIECGPHRIDSYWIRLNGDRIRPYQDRIVSIPIEYFYLARRTASRCFWNGLRVGSTTNSNNIFTRSLSYHNLSPDNYRVDYTPFCSFLQPCFLVKNFSSTQLLLPECCSLEHGTPLSHCTCTWCLCCWNALDTLDFWELLSIFFLSRHAIHTIRFNGQCLWLANTDTCLYLHSWTAFPVAAAKMHVTSLLSSQHKTFFLFRRHS